MTDELTQYLKNSRESRSKLLKLAQKIESSSDLPQLVPSQNNSEFLNPSRFRKFEENLNKDLQNYFKHEPMPQNNIVKSRSSSQKRNNIAAIYNYIHKRKKIPAVLPLINQQRKISIPDRLLGGKYVDRSAESSPTVASGHSIRRSFNCRRGIKEMLFVPVLKRNSSNRKKIFENL